MSLHYLYLKPAHRVAVGDTIEPFKGGPLFEVVDVEGDAAAGDIVLVLANRQIMRLHPFDTVRIAIPETRLEAS